MIENNSGDRIKKKSFLLLVKGANIVRTFIYNN